MTMTIEVQELEKLQKIETLLKELDIQYDKKEEIGINSDFGVKIVMNEEKILRENKHRLESIYNEIDYLAEKSNMIKVDKYHYVPKNDSPTFCTIFTGRSKLRACDWFMENVKEWVWISKEEGNEDLIQFYKDEVNEKIS